MLSVFWIVLLLGAQARDDSWPEGFDDLENCVEEAQMDRLGGESCTAVETGG